MWEAIKNIFNPPLRTNPVDSLIIPVLDGTSMGAGIQLHPNPIETITNPSSAIRINGTSVLNFSNQSERNFQTALAFTLSKIIEGGYVNNPKDPGGATNRGVTQRVYTRWLKNHGLVPKSVKVITLTEATEIYKSEYWFAANCDDIEYAPLAVALFDAAVNMGVSRAVSQLQTCLGTVADGAWGVETSTAFSDYLAKGNNKALLNCVLEKRASYYEYLNSHTSWGRTFIRGWRNRMVLLRKFLLRI